MRVTVRRQAPEPAALVGSVLAAFGAVSLWRCQPLAFALLMMPGVVTGLAVVAIGQPIRPRFFFLLSPSGMGESPHF